MKRFDLAPFVLSLVATCAWGQSANPGFAHSVQRLRTGDHLQDVRTLDADRDGDLDLFVLRSSSDGNQLFLNDGQGGFVEASDRLPRLRDRALDACVGDFDRDGDADLAVISRGGGWLRPFWRLFDRSARPEPYLLLNDGSGRFRFVPDALPWHGRPDSGRPTAATAADVDRDGDLDLILAGARGALLMRNDGNARFSRSALPGEGAVAVAAGDFDGDRGADALLARTFDAALTFPSGAPQAAQLPTAVGAVRDVASADLEGDQRDEVAFAGSSGSVVWLDGGQRRVDLPPARFVSAARGGPAGRGMFLFSVDRTPLASSGHGALAVWWDGSAVRQRHLPLAWSHPLRGVGADPTTHARPRLRDPRARAARRSAQRSLGAGLRPRLRRGPRPDPEPLRRRAHGVHVDEPRVHALAAHPPAAFLIVRAADAALTAQGSLSSVRANKLSRVG